MSRLTHLELHLHEVAGRTIIRADALHRLVAILRPLAVGHPDVAPAIRLSLRSLEILDQLWGEAGGVLENDPDAVDRIRLFLAGAAAWRALLDEGLQADPGTTVRAMSRAVATDGGGEPMHREGLVDVGALVVLSIAALRATDDIISSANIPFGLAAHASLGESIGRLVGAGPPAGDLRVLFDALPMQDEDSGRFAARIQPLLTDTREQARWLVLQVLRAAIIAYEQHDRRALDARAADRWTAVRIHEITGIEPVRGRKGDVVDLHGLWALVPGQRLAFRGVSGLTVLAEHRPPTVEFGVVAMVVPLDEPGWVGVFDPDWLAFTNAYRGRLRMRWSVPGDDEKAFSDVVEHVAYLRDETTSATAAMLIELVKAIDVPISAFVDVASPDTPERGLRNQFEGPDLPMGTLSVFEDDEALVLTWTSARATHVVLERVALTGSAGETPEVLSPTEPYGSIAVPKPEWGSFSFRLTPMRRTDGAVGEVVVAGWRSVERAGFVDVRISQHGESAPFVAGDPVVVDVRVTPTSAVGTLTAQVSNGGAPTRRDHHAFEQGRASWLIPADDVRSDTLWLRLELVEAGFQEVSEVWESGPIEVGSPRHRRMVLYRPTLVGDGSEPRRVEIELEKWSAQARRLGLALDLVDGLPAVPDRLDVVTGPIVGPEDGRTIEILDALRRVSVDTTGDAALVHVALLPGERDWQVSMLCPGAFRVAVATRGRMEELLRDLVEAGWSSYDPPEAQVLRVRGTLGRLGRFEAHSVREEARRVPTGRSVNHGTRSILEGQAGQIIEVMQGPALPRRLPGTVTDLVPLTPAVHAVSLEVHGQRVWRRVRNRAEGEVRLITDGWAPTLGRVMWAYDHPDGVMPVAVLEALRSGLWTTILDLPACDPYPMIHSRVGNYEDVRIVATDGWNASVAVPRRTRTHDLVHPIAIRTLDDGRLATSWPGAFRWLVDDRPVGEDVVAIEAPTRGFLELVAFDDDDEIVGSDHRQLP